MFKSGHTVVVRKQRVVDIEVLKVVRGDKIIAELIVVRGVPHGINPDTPAVYDDHVP